MQYNISEELKTGGTYCECKIYHIYVKKSCPIAPKVWRTLTSQTVY